MSAHKPSIKPPQAQGAVIAPKECIDQPKPFHEPFDAQKFLELIKKDYEVTSVDIKARVIHLKESK